MLDLVVNLFLCYLCFGLFSGEAFICLESDLGLNGNIEGHNNAFLGAHCLNIKILGLVNGDNACLVIGCLNGFGEYDIKGVFIENFFAVELLDHVERSLALAETGD